MHHGGPSTWRPPSPLSICSPPGSHTPMFGLISGLFFPSLCCDVLPPLRLPALLLSDTPKKRREEKKQLKHILRLNHFFFFFSCRPVPTGLKSNKKSGRSMGSPLSFVIWMNSTVKSAECYRLKRTRRSSKCVPQCCDAKGWGIRWWKTSPRDGSFVGLKIFALKRNSGYNHSPHSNISSSPRPHPSHFSVAPK